MIVLQILAAAIAILLIFIVMAILFYVAMVVLIGLACTLMFLPFMLSDIRRNKLAEKENENG